MAAPWLVQTRRQRTLPRPERLLREQGIPGAPPTGELDEEPSCQSDECSIAPLHVMVATLSKSRTIADGQRARLRDGPAQLAFSLGCRAATSSVRRAACA
jgi:hypothetical protein